MPQVSIILPVYNAEKYIVQTLRSVLDQSFLDFELIIVDDGSRDNSVNLIETFEDKRISFYRLSNRGPCRSRNFAISKARGKFIAFIDHDDLWQKDKLKKHTDHLNANGHVGVSYCASKFIDQNGEFVGAYQTPKLKNICLKDILCRNPIGNGSVPLIRKQLFDTVVFYKSYDGIEEPVYFDDQCRGWEDVELWFRMAYYSSLEFEGIPDVLNSYRVLEGGVSGDPDKKQQSFEAGIKRIKSYASNEVEKLESAARSYHLRYLARRLIFSSDSHRSYKYANKSLTEYPRIVIEEPSKTFATMLAAYLLFICAKLDIYLPMRELILRKGSKQNVSGVLND